MDQKVFQETLEKMSDHELMVALVLYLKDIKDLLHTDLEERGITPKHY